MNLPNKITFARILGVIIFVVVLSLDFKYKLFTAVILFLLLALTDFLDGYLARSTNQVTDLGKFMDPLADKLLISAALLYIVALDKSYMWMAFVIISREFLITGLRALAASKSIVIAASKLGKLKMVSQIVAVMFVLLNLQFAWFIMLIAVLLTVISCIDYLKNFKKLIKYSRKTK